MAEATGFEPVVSCVTGTYVGPATPRLRGATSGRVRWWAKQDSNL